MGSTVMVYDITLLFFLPFDLASSKTDIAGFKHKRTVQAISTFREIWLIRIKLMQACSTKHEMDILFREKNVRACLGISMHAFAIMILDLWPCLGGTHMMKPV